MKKAWLIFVFVLFIGAAQSFAQCSDIRIGRGRNWTAVKGLSEVSKCYRIRAKPGQKINLHLVSADKRVKFSMRQDYYDADFTAEDVRDWTGKVGDVNAYLISVGGGKRGTPFTLEVTIK